METGLIIKRLRKSECLSQSDLAEMLRVSRVYLSQIETGRKQASLELLRRIARIFKVPLALLVAWDENKDVESEMLKEMQTLFSMLLNQQLSRRLTRLHENRTPE